ncbi:uncharacterized protein DUF3618 [Nonomuraea fuscirosea]|uniref:Uncharacterized protein DUF3618 n=1 Tax=Nonomuraea fuscirosea TaxID=1291556 RepID=A0A2T0NBW8_9ACTN|nr:DUF3618 domain-containing protein [Nonomuraea fuscirosea]PRX70443.1 uncharacterized protein DUF3618 [Nonomuraea fuscirosea]
MSETDPGYSEQHAGNVGARRATVGTPTEHESINVPPTRPGAAENAHRAEVARQEHETFIPETPIPDERSEAAGSHRTEEESMGGARGEDDDQEDEDDVRRDIEKTRQELGETVSALAAKTDVKGRAGHAAELAKDKAGHAAELAKDKAGHAAELARDRAAGAADVVRDRAADVAEKVKAGTPDQVKDVAAEARKRPVMLVALAGVVVAFVARRMMRRRRAK